MVQRQGTQGAAQGSWARSRAGAAMVAFYALVGGKAQECDAGLGPGVVQVEGANYAVPPRMLGARAIGAAGPLGGRGVGGGINGVHGYPFASVPCVLVSCRSASCGVLAAALRRPVR